MNSKSKGEFGERVAKSHYEASGGEILETNYRFKRSEIDLIVLQEEMILIFVEVKSRSRKDFGEAETFVSPAQQNRIKEAAEDYIHGISWKKDIRFDIVCVSPNGEIEVFKDAF